MKGQDSKASNFDSYAKNYDKILQKSLDFSAFDTSYFDEYKVREVYKYLKKRNIATGLKILDFGCGIGKSIKYFRQYFPDALIYGIDVSQESIAIAKKQYSSSKNINFTKFNGELINYDFKFDIIFTANTFHHIDRVKHSVLLKEITDKLVQNGHFFIFEHNPFNPLTRKIFNTCEFDKNCQMLTPCYLNGLLKKIGLKKRTLRFTLFFPKFLFFLLPLEKFLYKFPIGAQYYYIIKK